MRRRALGSPARWLVRWTQWVLAPAAGSGPGIARRCSRGPDRREELRGS